jgi:UDP-glucose 4-epimerase
MYLNISTGTETSVVDLVAMLSTATGRHISPDYLPARDGDVARSVLDSAAAKRRIGWEPWTNLERGLDLTVEWFKGR